jgi:hypothetical protein
MVSCPAKDGEEDAMTPRSSVRCSICGFTEVWTDQVASPEPVLVAACLRCDHRWTEPAGSAPRAPRKVRSEHTERSIAA